MAKVPGCTAGIADDADGIARASEDVLRKVLVVAEDVIAELPTQVQQRYLAIRASLLRRGAAAAATAAQELSRAREEAVFAQQLNEQLGSRLDDAHRELDERAAAMAKLEAVAAQRAAQVAELRRLAEEERTRRVAVESAAAERAAAESSRLAELEAAAAAERRRADQLAAKVRGMTAEHDVLMSRLQNEQAAATAALESVRRAEGMMQQAEQRAESRLSAQQTSLQARYEELVQAQGDVEEVVLAIGQRVRQLYVTAAPLMRDDDVAVPVPPTPASDEHSSASWGVDVASKLERVRQRAQWINHMLDDVELFLVRALCIHEESNAVKAQSDRLARVFDSSRSNAEALVASANESAAKFAMARTKLLGMLQSAKQLDKSIAVPSVADHSGAVQHQQPVSSRSS